MHRHTIFQTPGDVACMPEIGKIHGTNLCHRQLGQDGHAVVPFLAACNDMAVACRGKGFERHFLDRAFTLLQAKYIGSFVRHQLEHQGFSEPYGIDVPRCQCK